MKQLLFFFSMLMLSSSIFAVEVTFQVDMSEQTVDAAGVHIAGSFAGDGYADWDPAAIALADQGSGIWAVTLTLTDAVSYEYKYVNGNSWGQDEGFLPGPCGNAGGNRNWTAGAVDESVPVHCYAACIVCAPPTYNVTFQVDMSEELVDAAGVHMAGGFGSAGYPEWDPAGIPLSDVGSGIWEVTLVLEEGTTYEYKYLNGNAWGLDEGTVPAPCGTGGGNRSWTVGAGDESLPLHCYASCVSCAPPTHSVTFQVDMSNETVDAAGVHMAGGFGSAGYAEWDPAGIPLTDVGSGIWEVVLILDEGTTYEYKYLNGNAWGLDEGTVPAPCGTGGGNRTWTVGTSDESVPVHCYASCVSCAPPTHSVTFQVDMSNETVDAAGVHMAGGFGSAGYPEWDPAGIPLTDVGSGIWEVTLVLEEGTAYEYKYLNGNAWGQDEGFVPGPCGTGGGNRTWTVGTSDESIALHCFATCEACVPPAAFHDVTFQVEMSLEVVDPAGVFLAGSFNGFDATATPMTDMGANIWAVTLSLEEGQTYQYKFLNGSTFDNQELVPMACGVDDGFGGYNRSHTVGTSNETIGVVCYSTCAPCTFVNYDITFQVDMSDEIVDPAGVHLIGTFNGFDPTADPMTDVGNGIWEVTVAIQSGQTVEYAFVNGNTAGGKEVIDVGCANPSNYREYFVTAYENTIGPVCFGLCSSCPSNLVNVTFQVDLSEIATNPIGVFIVGSFQDTPFTPGADQMTDPEMDDIWEFTVSLDPGTVIEYKYLNGPNWANEEAVPAACGVPNGVGGYNRTWTVGSEDETIALHCFSSCNLCGTPPVNVTFQVDMSEQVVDATGVFLAGSFNGFSTTADPLTDMGSGIWAITLPLEQGSYNEYVYLNGDSFAGQESVPSACGVDNGFGGFNRELNVGTSDLTIDLHCFSSCVICSPPEHNITFQVDMSLETVDPAGVYLAGDFNGFSTTATPLTDQGGGVWSVSLPLQEGVSYAYKYLNGDSFAGEETVPSECGVDNGFGGFNRSFTVGTADETIALHCFSYCVACPAPVNVTFTVDMSQQTVDPMGVYVAGDFNAWTPEAMTDIGNGMWEATILLNANSSFEYKFVNGIDLGTQAETIPAECESNGNRTVTTTDSDMSVPTVCFGLCTGCFIDLTFQVDMWNETVAPEGVHIAGSFQGWDPAATPMDYLGFGIWAITIQVERFSYYEWKYVNGNSWGADEDVPVECQTNWNRFITTGGDSQTLDVVCFGSCTRCDGCLDPFSLEYNPFAVGDNGSCATPVVWGCTYADATNYMTSANTDDGSCLFEAGPSDCPGDLNDDGVINTGDLTNLLGSFGTFCP